MWFLDNASWKIRVLQITSLKLSNRDQTSTHHNESNNRTKYQESAPPAMSSRSREYDRPRSRADNFMDALESGRVREALGELKPSRSSNGHRQRHHGAREYDYYDEGPTRRGRYDVYYPGEAGYYYESSPRPRRHRSAHSERHHDDRRRHHGHGHKRASSSHGGPDLKQAAGAAVAAGVVEAWRSRHDADRAMRVATAALGAAATDSALAARHDHKEKRHVVESALAGLVENRVINGPRR
ncbi:hypothetical protein GQX73_g169 [Xylaria multiplex]|uniref:DUF3824 domain-containing protein n=1 Tax=Xylaria multiplex TaxID=323545 RepID=A0A7C8N513_9PEZI|nr:hypothetical protein GQX73_g169 [Xylaria multiplex]